MQPTDVVTGGSGFIGSALVQHLLDQGRKVLVIDNFSREHPETIFRRGRQPQILHHDLTRPIPEEAWEGTVGDVYHLAGVVGVEKTALEPDVVLEVNSGVALNLFSWLRRRRPRCLCVASTSEVYATAVVLGLAPLPTPEDATLAVGGAYSPRSSYAVSKILLEQLALSHAYRHGLRVRVVRYHNVYGPRMGMRHVVPQFIERALARDAVFRVNGAQRRCFCYITDAVADTVSLTQLDRDDPLVVNIGNADEETAIVSLAERIKCLVGNDAPIEILEAAANSPERRIPDLRRLEELLGERTRTALETGLHRTVEWYRDRLDPANAVREATA